MILDGDRCQGHGRCYSLFPELFAPDEQGNAMVVATALPGDAAERAQRAVHSCPEHAITTSDRVQGDPA